MERRLYIRPEFEVSQNNTSQTSANQTTRQLVVAALALQAFLCVHMRTAGGRVGR